MDGRVVRTYRHVYLHGVRADMPGKGDTPEMVSAEHATIKTLNFFQIKQRTEQEAVFINGIYPICWDRGFDLSVAVYAPMVRLYHVLWPYQIPY